MAESDGIDVRGPRFGLHFRSRNSASSCLVLPRPASVPGSCLFCLFCLICLFCLFCLLCLLCLFRLFCLFHSASSAAREIIDRFRQFRLFSQFCQFRLFWLDVDSGLALAIVVFRT